jgi:hypothetical protein
LTKSQNALRKDLVQSAIEAIFSMGIIIWGISHQMLMDFQWSKSCHWADMDPTVWAASEPEFASWGPAPNARRC